MAIFLKRSFSYRNFILLRNFANQTCNFSFSVNHFSHSWTSDTSPRFPLPPPDFIRETRRGFAKGRKSSNDHVEYIIYSVHVSPAPVLNRFNFFFFFLCWELGKMNLLQVWLRRCLIFDPRLKQTLARKWRLR